MKVFWWQCGLHIEPETKEENAALCLLIDSAKLTSIAAVNGSLQATGVIGQQLLKGVIADHEVSPCANTAGIEQLANQ